MICPLRLGRRHAVVLPLLACGFLASTARAQQSFSRFLFPLAKPLPSPRVVIDVSDSPESRPWALKAQQLAHDWFPYVSELLATEHWTPPRMIRLVFKKAISAPAYTSNGTITINADWIRRHPDDFGMVIHEMTHIVQSYPHNPGDPGWLVEGIADYIRWWRYEPEAPRTPVDPLKASYRDSYRTTATFLAWMTGHYDRTLVHELDRALRNGAYSDSVFQTVTGKTVDQLWSEFVATLK